MIIGEVRNKEEVEALFDVLMAGQARGSYATFHARSTDEAIARLRSFGISNMDMQSIDCIIVQRRMTVYDAGKRKNKEIRRVIEIAELGGEKPTMIYKNDAIGESKLIEKAAESFGLDNAEMKEEIAKRKKIISRARIDYLESYHEIQKTLYGIEGW